MEQNKILLILAGIALLIIAGFLLMGYYPAAIVNGRIISIKELNDNYSIASRFYKAQLNLSDQTGEIAEVISEDEAEKEIRRAVLESLIINSLISEGLAARIGRNDLERMVGDKMAKTDLGSENAQKGIQLLYGLSTEELRDFVLLPQIKQEILENNFMAADLDFDDWLNKEANDAGVSIFIGGFNWRDSAVKLNQEN